MGFSKALNIDLILPLLKAIVKLPLALTGADDN